jgi:choline dehydrogenase-like flavoprotein
VSPEFDAIVCGSGITGGWAAKELTERGLRVLMIERGPNLEHRTDYRTEFVPPWDMPYRGFGDPKALLTTKRIQKRARMDEWTAHLFVNDDVETYETPPESDFQWRRGYHLGGRSLMWGRQCYRMGEDNFAANARDGHGVPWPIAYSDVSSWYDYVERFIGVNGNADGIASLPDGQYQPTMGINAGERRLAELVARNYTDRRVVPARVANLTQPIGDRVACQNRNQCARGCSFGAYFSTQSSTLPAAKATGRLTLITDSIVDALEYDPATRRVSGVRVRDARDGSMSVRTARIVFLCTGSVNSLGVLLRSVSGATPNGLGNSSGLLGKYFMDHCSGAFMIASMPGMEDQMYLGRKPNGIIVPRWVNTPGGQQADFLRGYSYQGLGMRSNWSDAVATSGIGKSYKESLRRPGTWHVGFGTSIECLPRASNQVSVNFDKKNADGLPLMRIDVRWSDNELKAAAHAHGEMRKMLALAGGHVLVDRPGPNPPGGSTHEMGGAPMGDDPGASVTNRWNQLHDAANVFVTDGACMNSTGDRNPSLTYMALTARAAAHAATLISDGAL